MHEKILSISLLYKEFVFSMTEFQNPNKIIILYSIDIIQTKIINIIYNLYNYFQGTKLFLPHHVYTKNT